MTAEELRCLCGSLVARVKKTAIELKCRRCKRVALIPFPKKERKALEEGRPEIFRYEITFHHPAELESAPSDSGSAGGRG